MEKIQERALRFVFQIDDFNSVYEELLNKVKIPSFTCNIRRHRTMAISTFKILNKLSPTVLTDLVNLKENNE